MSYSTLSSCSSSWASWTKVTGAGSTVAVSLASDHRRGIMFADVPWRGNRINRIRYFPA